MRIAFCEVEAEKKGEVNKLYSLGTHFSTGPYGSTERWPRSTTGVYFDSFKKWSIVETWQLPGGTRRTAYKLSHYGLLFCHRLAAFAPTAALNDQRFLRLASCRHPLLRKLLHAFPDIDKEPSPDVRFTPLFESICGRTIFKDPLWYYGNVAGKEENTLVKVRLFIFPSMIPYFASISKWTRKYWEEEKQKEWDKLMLSLCVKAVKVLHQQNIVIPPLSPTEEALMNKEIKAQIDFEKSLYLENIKNVKKFPGEVAELEQLLTIK
jgi:hypothetical protein